ncbi:hypothetical protein SDC9_131610 [bioreactor metagenome]|uniref:Uncharacterized protein n=1 Tax=bioreactor metagenome TaxID=1076179 RepID=A0A645D5Q5_9ZZZZ
MEKPHVIGVAAGFSFKLQAGAALRCLLRAKMQKGMSPSGFANKRLQSPGHRIIQELEKGDEVRLPGAIRADQHV